MQARNHARHARLKAFHALYRRIDNGGVCVYCGARATTVDHFVPLSIVAALQATVDVLEGRFLVPACGECNGIAGDRIFKTVAAKRRYIQGRLAHKYRKSLALPDWDEDELTELSYALRSSVLSGLAIKAWLEQRLAYRNSGNPAALELSKIRSAFGLSQRQVESAKRGKRKNVR